MPTRHNRILIVDDDKRFAEDLASVLSPDYGISMATDGNEAIKLAVCEKPTVILLDIDLGSEPSGVEVLSALRRLDDTARVMMLTGDDRIESVVQCIRMGAVDYITKPPDAVGLQLRVKRCFREAEMLRRTQALEQRIQDWTGELVAVDRRSQQIVQQIERVAATDATVLITGESGTGKEMVATRIHQLSQRSRGVFLPINCTAISPTLMESTLFGHEKGAFTGADAMQPGQFELADGGTLFLDEIGDSSPMLQQKLLRVLENGTFHRVGGSSEITTDVRLIAATNAELEKARKEGRFRDDLFHRINVYRIHLSPLRERPDDVVPLAERFLARLAADQGKVVAGFSRSAEEYLRANRWPGNVRDLRNAVERAVINCSGELVEVVDLTVGGDGARFAAVPRSVAKKMADREFYIGYLTSQIALADGVRKKAAELSGMTPQSFSRLCKEWGIE